MEDLQCSMQARRPVYIPHLKSCCCPVSSQQIYPLCFFPDPYVKVSLMCEGRRLKKRKSSTKRNTLNPIYNEAIVFDVPPENIDQISLLIAVMDYDR